MTVSKTTSSATFFGNGAATAFSLPFYVSPADTLRLYVVDEAGVLDQVLSGFSFVGNETAETTALTFTSAPISGTEFYAVRETTPSQLVSLKGQVSYNPTVVEGVWDKLTRLVQEVQAGAGKLLRTTTVIPPVKLIAGRVLAANDAGTAVICGPSILEISEAVAQTALDRVATGEDRATVEQIAERIDLGELDAAVAATAADRVQTALDRTASQAARAAAETAKTLAQTAAANAQASALTCATWAVLSTLTGSTAGQGAEVLDTDTGTHTDPVVGGTVSNAGRYTWSASPAGWKRIGATGLSGKMPLNGLDGIPDGWEVYESPYFDGISICDAGLAEISSSYTSTAPGYSQNFLELFEVITSQHFDGISICDASFAEFFGGYSSTADNKNVAEVTTIAVFGDSLSADASKWCDYMAAHLGWGVLKVARGSLTSTEIAALANANPTKITFSGNTITGGTASVTTYTVDIVRNGGVYGAAAGGIAGYCYDAGGTKVEMTLRSNSDGTYYVNGAPSGTYTFSPATNFYTNIGETAKDMSKIILLGRNNIGAADQIAADCLAIANYGSTKSLMVLSSLTGKWGTSGAVTSMVIADAARKRGLFGAAFFDLNAEAAVHGIRTAIDLGLLPDDGSYPTADDTAAAAAGNLPVSFFGSDTVHPLDMAHQVMGWIMANLMRSKF